MSAFFQRDHAVAAPLHAGHQVGEDGGVQRVDVQQPHLRQRMAEQGPAIGVENISAQDQERMAGQDGGIG